MAKKKDFEKPKLRVGKAKPARANQTDASVQTRTIVLPNQLRGPSLDTYLALTRHHQAPQRRQAVANIVESWNRYPTEHGRILESICPLLVDEDRAVRHTALHALGEIDAEVLAAHMSAVLLYIHAAMTHISPQVRADSTRGLDLAINRCPDEVSRLGFARSLALFFPLLGWPESTGKSSLQQQGSTVATTLSFGKLAAKTRATHLQSLQNLVTLGLAPDKPDLDLLFHPDTQRFLIPKVGTPFAPGLTEDREARAEALDALREPMNLGLASSIKEGGEMGRVAAKLISILGQVEY